MNIEERKLWIFLVLLVGGIAFAIGDLSTHASQSAAKMAGAWKAVHPADLPRPAAMVDPKKDGAATTPSTAFKAAADRLQGAFRQHSGFTEQELIQKANRSAPAAADKPCPFEWHDGQPELQVRQDQVGKLSLSNSFSNCAQAIEDIP